MGQGHGHGGAAGGHGHAGAGTDRRRLAIALVVTLATTVLGAVGAAITGSLALLADLSHLLTDAGALVAALIAAALAARPATARRTYGMGRAEVLVAALNALTLVAVVGWVVVEAVQRLFEPQPVPGLPMLVIGVLGLVGNLISLAVLSGGDRGNMNLRGALLHVLGDALGSVGVLVAAVVLMTTGWPYADTIASLVIVAIVLPRAVALLREAAHVLLEGAPKGIDGDDVRDALLAVPGVTAVHDLHLWAINDRTPAMSAHLVVTEELTAHCGDESVLDAATQVLRERFGLDHSTLQVEHAAHVGHENHCG
ncbi:cation diffusion facilitator family transporter [Pseudonocardia sp. HH130630-07]|uniref:cation diffusion facilitator family transporter n=1 Tax=Pseudonocardia sp. HH130630-07 TaxID=1690815 RepID=UPI00081513F2|nr:cation diffusion facilitator family transporter [Pseudonocardia sp. HH130630-07]ANY08716.1 cation diffusion facilitator family transporter [Pseudonocardia sp. HH130630-07]